MNLSATAIKNSTAHLFIHLFKKYLFNGCHISDGKVNKTDETYHHIIYSPSSLPHPQNLETTGPRWIWQ